MGKITLNTLENNKWYLLAISGVILVLLSSCVIKNSIETFLNLPVETEQTYPKGGHSFIVNSNEECAAIDFLDNQIVQNIYSSTDDLLPAVIFTTFLFLIVFHPIKKEGKHPLYKDSGKIRNNIPIFLEYRKLIIHHTH